MAQRAWDDHIAVVSRIQRTGLIRHALEPRDGKLNVLKIVDLDDEIALLDMTTRKLTNSLHQLRNARNINL